MTNLELNQYILHYIKDNHTKSAIMLTAGWGTGKSYYIQKKLIPFLAKKENGAYSCLVVSLYGLKTIEDISKNLYLESRLKFLRKKSEKAAAGELVAKTIVNGIISLWGVDLYKSERTLQKLYQSIDLSQKLVIFEDIERSKIDIVDILSYTYNLVEQDNVKVLLVANEDEILKHHNSEPEETSIYLAIKEKTISDTISYKGNLRTAISKLIKQFNNITLNQFTSDDNIDAIIDTMKTLNNYNLRSFQFACQKTSDIFQKIGVASDKYIQAIFFSVLVFTMQIKNGNFPDWEGTDYLSTKLGTGKFPLYRFCYDYIRWQEFDAAKVQKAFDAHRKYDLYNKDDNSVNDMDLSVLFTYYVHPEKKVLDALHNIENRLNNPEEIRIYSYCKLAYYLVVCQTILEFDYSACKEKMTLNLQKYGKNIDPDILFLNDFDYESESARQQFKDFLQDLQKAINIAFCAKSDFSYHPDDLEPLRRNIIQNKAEMVAGHIFISKFDLEKVVTMLFQCSPLQLQHWRDILFAVYRNALKSDFLDADRLYMSELVEKIESVLSEKEKHMDRIVLLQIRYLISNLKGFVENLS
ncbi:MAG: hypothetical protein HFF10_05570 [Angelakisella sp.]|nr:hypothetical protein [Angelakisella sp.]